MKKLEFDVIFRLGLEYFLKDMKTEQQVKSKYGKPDDVESYKENILLYHYGNVRFKFRDFFLEEAVIYFLNYDYEYPITSIDKDNLSLSKETNVCDLLYYFNTNELGWNLDLQKYQKDYLFISLKTNVHVVFYLFEAKLERIIIGGGSVSDSTVIG